MRAAARAKAMAMVKNVRIPNVKEVRRIVHVKAMMMVKSVRMPNVKEVQRIAHVKAMVMAKNVLMQEEKTVTGLAGILMMVKENHTLNVKMVRNVLIQEGTIRTNQKEVLGIRKNALTRRTENRPSVNYRLPKR